LQVEAEARRNASFRHLAVALTRGRISKTEADVCRAVFGPSDVERGTHKKAVKPAIKRRLIVGLIEQFKVSERQGCRVMAMRRSVYCYGRDRIVTERSSSCCWS